MMDERHNKPLPEPEDGPSPLEAELRSIHHQFQSAFHTLCAFVDRTEKFIDEQTAQTARVRDKVQEQIDAFRRNEPPPSYNAPDDEEPKDVVKLELTREQSDALLIATREYADLHAKFPSILGNMSLIYVLALWDAFVTDAISAVLRSRPEMMRSGAQITYETVLEYRDMTSLVSVLANREVERFAYLSAPDQFKRLDEQFGVDVSCDDEFSLPQVFEANARRNILVHNNGLVNEMYLAAVPGSEFGIGDQLDVDAEYLRANLEITRRLANSVLDALVAKFC